MQTKNDEKTVETKMGVILIIIVISIPGPCTLEGGELLLMLLGGTFLVS